MLVPSVFIAIIPTHLLCQMWANPPEAEFQGTIAKLKQRNKISSLLVYVLHKPQNLAFSRRSHAKTGKKCTKKRDARAKLLFCSLNQLIFFMFTLPSAPLDLKLRTMPCAQKVVFFQRNVFQNSIFKLIHLHFVRCSCRSMRKCQNLMLSSPNWKQREML